MIRARYRGGSSLCCRECEPVTWETVETVTRTELGRFPRFTHALRHHDGRLASLMCGGVTKRWRVVDGEPTCQKCAAWKKKILERERVSAAEEFLQELEGLTSTTQHPGGWLRRLPDSKDAPEGAPM